MNLQATASNACNYHHHNYCCSKAYKVYNVFSPLIFMLLQDLIIFPGDAEFKRVTQCNTGRVYILKFKDSARKYFYWMQEPSEDKDEELMKKVILLLLL